MDQLFGTLKQFQVVLPGGCMKPEHLQRRCHASYETTSEEPMTSLFAEDLYRLQPTATTRSCMRATTGLLQPK
ncbi:hypothetical protein BGK72_37585 [Streptomyces agglomeratus]|nr:hypothetical protein BGK72_37585 [Streptomyces agglomeratus]